MKYVITCAITILFSTALVSAHGASIAVPNTPGDKGRYEIISISRSGLITKTTHKRTGPSGVGFTKMEINCAGLLYREMGYVDDDLSKMKIRPGRWTDFVAGSSKHKVAIVACSQEL